MKSCEHCEHAVWNKTKAGRLHPSGDGRCVYKVKMPQLPAAKWWWRAPVTIGGFINRRRELKEHCQCWSPKEQK